MRVYDYLGLNELKIKIAPFNEMPENDRPRNILQSQGTETRADLDSRPVTLSARIDQMAAFSCDSRPWSLLGV